MVEPSPLPRGLTRAVEALTACGERTWLVGDTAMQCLANDPLAGGLRRDLLADGGALATTASPQRLCDVFVHAVSQPGPRPVFVVPLPGLRPVDVFPLAPGESLERFLDACDFRVRAIAIDPTTWEVVDPHGGRDDLAKQRLGCVGDAHACLATQPLRGLRAARLHATTGLAPDDELVAALSDAASEIGALRGPAVRAELCRMLVAPHAGSAIALLRQTGIERRLFRGVREDAGVLVDRMPPEIGPRLVAWLRGCPAAAPLRRMRFGVERSSQIRRLLDLHPLDQTIRPARDASVSRLMRVTSPAERELLFDLRLQEAALEDGTAPADVTARLDAVRGGIARIEQRQRREQARGQLAIDGETVMRILGCGPGRRVGQALRHLAERVAEEPSRNDRETLLSLLADWNREHDG